MGKFKISKSFDACYAHRVHTQELNEKFSLDNQCKCRHIHGHQMTLKVGLEATELERGMVTDFKHLNIIKKFIDEVIDHKFIMDINDPLFLNIFHEIRYDSDILWVTNSGGKRMYGVPDFRNLENIQGAVFEKLEGLVIVDFVPTSENLCKFFAEITNEKLQGLLGNRVKLCWVEFFETPTSSCRFELA